MSELSGVGRAFLLLLLITSLGGCFVWAFWEFEQVRDRRRRRVAAVAKRWILVVGLFGLMALPAPGRDLDGRYKNSPLHDWFENLASGKGRCCSEPTATSSKRPTGKQKTVTIAYACRKPPTPKI